MEEQIDFEKYREYFIFSDDGSFSIRTDFREHIKTLKGKLHLLYDYLTGESNVRYPDSAYTKKEEDDCTYRYIPEKFRWDVYERDDFKCKHCGSKRYLSIDHITPKSKGGKTTLENCQTLCRPCNSKKGAR
jgi:5-methylcytosine-specific restriction endonuclease McrA